MWSLRLRLLTGSCWGEKKSEIRVASGRDAVDASDGDGICDTYFDLSGGDCILTCDARNADVSPTGD